MCIVYGNTIKVQIHVTSTFPPHHVSFTRIALSNNIANMEQQERQVLTAVSSSARQLFLLLRCIAFSNKAQVVIRDDGIRVSVAETSTLEGECTHNLLLRNIT